MGEAVEHAAILPTIPAEEDLPLAEDAAHAIDGHAPVFQDVQVVVPELVLDEEGHLGPYDAQEAPGIGDGVERQVADDVGSGIVLAHLVARRREERQQDLQFRTATAQLFHQRASLLKLPKRCGMEPYIVCLRVHLLAQHPEGVALATPHLAHLLVELAGDGHAQKVEINDEVIHIRPVS